jgi:uncharacterized protein
MFNLLVAFVGVVSAAIAWVTGFGIGSLLTPTFAIRTGTKLAVAAVAIPHVVATAQRFWLLRRHVDRRVLLGFGMASAIGGLAGALLHIWVSNRFLSVAFGVVVALTGIAELTGWMRRVHWGRSAAWTAGTLSGGLGGLVGNQGGIRTAAMLGFDVPKEAFVATSTAVGLFVDGARLPVYLATDWRAMLGIWPLIALATGATMVGTAIGGAILGRISKQAFRRVIAALLIILGVYMLVQARG